MKNQEFQVAGSQVIVHLAGDLQGELVAEIRETLLDYIEKGYYNFTLNFSKVTGINSTGLGTLVNIQKRALQNGGNIVLTELQGLAKTAFERTRLTKAFPILQDSDSDRDCHDCIS
ncbi:MAG TPA: STAS domain-containing protein [Methylomusa anaerophila]|uniref:Anti-sigma factor antagonist n=1 Tax=Methylomusa anaerophila TaxID=1930071 RepID=A0A348AMR7_9FIRM|nr:STAS domain-containing protein [Methylomusa anaerophila]BBB92365.1 anti-sigma-B factor antagonist [Methylomusa anaerophila]HML89996.1 STAS domain-containing protein [Methylomusa anaerophila]